MTRLYVPRFPVLVLERTFDELWLARVERREALARVMAAKTACRTVELHHAQRDAKRLTTNVIRLERGR